MNRRDFLQSSTLLAADTLLTPQLRAQSSPIATTASGKVRGSSDQGILIFKGIPYGTDTASTRFAPPTPPQPWTGIRDCLAFGPQAPQPIHPRQGRSAFAPLDEANPSTPKTVFT